jgi:hypothetical protein
MADHARGSVPESSLLASTKDWIRAMADHEAGSVPDSELLYKIIPVMWAFVHVTTHTRSLQPHGSSRLPRHALQPVPPITSNPSFHAVHSVASRSLEAPVHTSSPIAKEYQ